MRSTVVLSTALIAAFGFAACSEPVTSPPSQQFSRLNAPAASVEGVMLQRGSVQLSAAAQASDLRSNGALNPSDYVCPESTPLDDWFLGEAFRFINAEASNFTLLYQNLLADQVVTYGTLFFETTAKPQVFGYNGEYTKAMTKGERQLKSFWDINSSGIQLVAMKGTMLLDTARVAATYRYVFGVPAPTAAALAALVHNGVASSTVLNGGNHPLFSFNSFAYSPGDGSIPDKIAMGDGILEGYHALGFDDVAPIAILAHEFSHHIQYAHDYFSDHYATAGSAAEQTQYTELMADAYAAYFLTHSRGATMNRKRVTQFLEVFFDLGDCAFSDPSHHGTPNQRMRAANFGFDLADQAQKQGHIMSSSDFHDLFVAAYPGIVAPDAH
jgi:hypothetical protein